MKYNEEDYHEVALPDDYPVYAGYMYVADGQPIMSEITGCVRQLKQHVKAQEIKSCDLVRRGMI